MDGTCDCGDFEGEFCQKPSSVSKQLIGRFGIYIFLLIKTAELLNSRKRRLLCITVDVHYVVMLSGDFFQFLFRYSYIYK